MARSSLWCPGQDSKRLFCKEIACHGSPALPGHGGTARQVLQADDAWRLAGSSEQGRRQWMPVRRGKPGQLPADREQWFCSTFGREAIPEDRPDRFAAPMAQPPHPLAMRPVRRRRWPNRRRCPRETVKSGEPACHVAFRNVPIRIGMAPALARDFPEPPTGPSRPARLKSRAWPSAGARFLKP